MERKRKICGGERGEDDGERKKKRKRLGKGNEKRKRTRKEGQM